MFEELRKSQFESKEKKEQKLLQHFLPDPSMNQTSHPEFNYINNLFWDMELYIYSNLHYSPED